MARPRAFTTAAGGRVWGARTSGARPGPDSGAADANAGHRGLMGRALPPVARGRCGAVLPSRARGTPEGMGGGQSFA